MDVCVSVSLPHGALGWSAVSDCGISWSYSLILYTYATKKLDLGSTPGRRQSKTLLTLLTINQHRLKITRNSVFDCHLCPVGQQMAIENSVSNDFSSTFVKSINVVDSRLPGVNQPCID